MEGESIFFIVSAHPVEVVADWALACCRAAARALLMASQLGPAVAMPDAMPTTRNAMVLRLVFMVMFPCQVGLSFVARKCRERRLAARERSQSRRVAVTGHAWGISNPQPGCCEINRAGRPVARIRRQRVPSDKEHWRQRIGRTAHYRG